MVCTDEMENSLSEEEPNQHVIEERCEERSTLIIRWRMEAASFD
jgi:hypothetical protein